MIGPVDIVETIAATWPSERVDRVGAFDIGRGAGGGNRVSAARLTDPSSTGADITVDDVATVSTAQKANGDEALFMVFGWQADLAQTLDENGYQKRDETILLTAPVADVAEPPPPVSCFEIWPPLAVQEEIWETGGIGSARLAIMQRAKGPKTSLFGRVNDRPAGSAFIGVHGNMAMLHALEVAPEARRNGLGRLMVRAGAAWAKEHGAEVFAVLVTRDNTVAQGLYASLGLKPVESYHYRVK